MAVARFIGSKQKSRGLGSRLLENGGNQGALMGKNMAQFLHDLLLGMGARDRQFFD